MKHYIYIPGLGDHFDLLRRFVLSIRWRNTQTRVTFVPMRWANRRETYEEKYQRVVKAIEHANGDKIILVGESAGGAMALFTFSRYGKEIDGVVTICGYNHDAADVNPRHKTEHPAFYRLMPAVDKTVTSLTPKDRVRITTIYSTGDSTVIPEHSHIDGAKAVVLHKPGHFSNIARVLLSRNPLDRGV